GAAAAGRKQTGWDQTRGNLLRHVEMETLLGGLPAENRGDTRPRDNGVAKQRAGSGDRPWPAWQTNSYGLPKREVGGAYDRARRRGYDADRRRPRSEECVVHRGPA